MQDNTVFKAICCANRVTRRAIETTKIKMWILLGVLLEVAHAVKAPAYASMMAIEDYLFYEMDGEVATEVV